MTIKELREKLYISQNDLAKAVGIPRSSIRNYENGICTPSDEVISKIEKYYDVEIDIPGRSPDKLPTIYIQSPMGGTISTDEIRERVGNVDTVYVRVDHNKLYWVKNDDTGSLNIWD